MHFLRTSKATTTAITTNKTTETMPPITLVLVLADSSLSFSEKHHKENESTLTVWKKAPK